MATIEVRVAAALDDCSSEDSVFATNELLIVGKVGEVTWYQTMRFLNIAISQGSTILAAYITLKENAVRTNNDCHVAITGDDTDDAVAPTNQTEFDDLNATNDVLWHNIIEATTGSAVINTVSIVAAVQQIVDRVGWASGNAMQFKFAEDGSSINASRSYASYDSSPSDAPLLHIEYLTYETFPTDAVARVSSIRHIWQPSKFTIQVGLGDLGFDVDVAEATVREALDTAKPIEKAPPEPPMTVPPIISRVAPTPALAPTPPPTIDEPPRIAGLTEYAKRILEERAPAIEVLRMRAKARKLGVTEVSVRTVEIFMKEPEKIAILQEIAKLSRSAQASGITGYARQVLQRKITELQSKLAASYRRR